MTRRPTLEVREGGSNSMAVFYRVAPADSPNAFCTVRVTGAGVMCCLTDLHDRRCVHIRAVEDHLHDQRAGTTPAAA